MAYKATDTRKQPAGTAGGRIGGAGDSLAALDSTSTRRADGTGNQDLDRHARAGQPRYVDGLDHSAPGRHSRAAAAHRSEGQDSRPWPGFRVWCGVLTARNPDHRGVLRPDDERVEHRPHE